MHLQMNALAALQGYRTAPCPKHFVSHLPGSFITSLTSLVIQEGWWAGTHTVIHPRSLLSDWGGASKRGVCEWCL